MTKNSQELQGMLVIITLSILIGVAFVVGQATMESRTYNKLTGAQTTWWDALWVELRVQNETK